MGPLTRGAAASDQQGRGAAGTQHLFGALCQPSIQPGPWEGACCATPPMLPWPRSFARLPSNCLTGRPPRGQPRLRSRLEGQGGRCQPLGRSVARAREAAQASVFSLAHVNPQRCHYLALPGASLPAWSSSPDLVLGLKVHPAHCLFPPSGPSAPGLRASMSFI